MKKRKEMQERVKKPNPIRPTNKKKGVKAKCGANKKEGIYLPPLSNKRRAPGSLDAHPLQKKEVKINGRAMRMIGEKKEEQAAFD